MFEDNMSGRGEGVRGLCLGETGWGCGLGSRLKCCRDVI